MCIFSVTIAIEFADEVWRAEPVSSPPPGVFLRVVEAHTDAGSTFTLVYDAESVYTLTANEVDELLRLLGQMAPKAPWKAVAGFDGCTYSLILRGPMSGITFEWWMEVPEGWESVGAVVDYVMRLGDRAGLAITG